MYLYYGCQEENIGELKYIKCLEEVWHIVSMSVFHNYKEEEYIQAFFQVCGRLLRDTPKQLGRITGHVSVNRGNKPDEFEL